MSARKTSPAPVQPEPAESTPNAARRNKRAHESILHAAADLLEDGGYQSLSIEMIARRAGVGKQTIYRWWRSKAEIVLEAETLRTVQRIPQPDTGSLEGDLRAIVLRYVDIFKSPGIRHAWTGLVAEAQIDPLFGESFLAGFARQRREPFLLAFGRAHKRGELAAGMDVDVLTDLFHGAVWYRLITHRPLSRAYVLKLVQHAVNAALRPGL